MFLKRRIFIAVNLPQDFKKRLIDFKEKWDFMFARQNPSAAISGGPFRWTKKDSLHVTLVFIGYVTNDEVYEICKLTREIAQEYEPFSIGFKKILYGPPGKATRMIWLEGKVSEELSKIKQELDNILGSSSAISPFRIESRPFSPHITLARKKMEKREELSQLPEIGQDFQYSIPVSSLDVMESDLKPDGAEYIILESCPLG